MSRLHELDHLRRHVLIPRVDGGAGEGLVDFDTAEGSVLDLVAAELGVRVDPEGVALVFQGVDEDRVVDGGAVGLDLRPVGRMDAVEEPEDSMRRRVAGAEVLEKDRRSLRQRVHVRRHGLVHGVEAPALQHDHQDVGPSPPRRDRAPDRPYRIDEGPDPIPPGRFPGFPDQGDQIPVLHRFAVGSERVIEGQLRGDAHDAGIVLVVRDDVNGLAEPESRHRGHRESGGDPAVVR